jgi:hypothetical protein
MSVDPEALFNAAMRLTDGERLDLAYRILDTLPDPPGISIDDPNLIEELNRRFADMEGSVPASELWKEDSDD